jgi:two-component system, NarL family, nitrate/nitrite response regulator NarL
MHGSRLRKAVELTESELIRIAILDDHQSILDGYLYRFNQVPDIEVVGTATNAEALEPILRQTKPDVLILDVFVPTSAENLNYYPILQAIPKWLQTNQNLSILVISMHNLRTLVVSVMEAGASGYVLKDDQAAIQELGSIIRTIASGGVYFSKQSHQHLLSQTSMGALLTARQVQALSLCGAYPDATTGELADRLGIAHSTFRNLLSGAYLRLEVHNRTAAIATAKKLGLITPEEPTPSIQEP